MKNLQAKAWALQRPTGEIMPAFIRRTREEVLLAVVTHLGKGSSHWRHMRGQGFSVARVALMKLHE